MKRKLEIKGVMTPFPHSIGYDQTLKDAKQMMRDHSVRHLPVQKGGELIGVITQRDIDFAVAVDKQDPSELSVEDAFTAEPYIVELDAEVATVASRMANNRFGCVLVVQKDKLAGIFTAVDACRTLGLLLRGEIEGN